jgi:hypothetical protein
MQAFSELKLIRLADETAFISRCNMISGGAPAASQRESLTHSLKTILNCFVKRQEKFSRNGKIQIIALK